MVKGHPLDITVTARDVDGLRLSSLRGRVIRFQLSNSDKGLIGHYDTTFNMQAKTFELRIPHTGLRQTGCYKIWISHAFGFSVNSTEKLQLPTDGFRATFYVVESSDQSSNIVKGATAGVLAALFVILLMYQLKHNRQRAKKVLLLFLNVEARMLGKVTAELWDLFSDGYLLFSIVLKSTDPAVQRLVPPWIVCFCIATVASLVSLSIKIKVFIVQFRNRREQVWELDGLSKRAKKLRVHQKRLVSTGKTITMIYASMLIGGLECIPMVPSDLSRCSLALSHQPLTLSPEP